MTVPVRVLVVDDQPLIRHSLRLVLDGADGLTVVGEAGSGEAAVEVARRTRPDVVLMDVRMPGGDGIDATRRIAADPDLTSTRVLVLSMFELDEYVHGALRAGASGFLLKDAEPTSLVDAVRRTHAGESLFAPAVLARIVGHYLDGGPQRGAVAPQVLTSREVEVLALVGRGLSNQEIGRRLTISMGTVKTHIGNLLAKLVARDRAQLVIAAFDHGLVTAERPAPGRRPGPA
ncbi:response regulator transcription factor [Oerskovia sp. Root22]|uniref:response regulator n=1 Tax=Oerskovia sp. Root22 TaxID=1736494 RepID=UPI0006FAE3E9|nr:response regulator transcription factor [Oerskovia sp. Root22]KRC42777.1 LuxR family transcriptional regulator [Oerskovia sp. Root22]